jgi:hypothetical protein
VLVWQGVLVYSEQRLLALGSEEAVVGKNIPFLLFVTRVLSVPVAF